jgi:type VII secretion protein EccB
MASNRDILDAQRFNRSRLTTAFISGMPGGRELEPKSGFAPLVIGIVITALLVGAAFVLRQFAPSLPEGWENNHVLVLKESGARYYTIDAVMHPITNITSARLLAPAGSFQVAEVSTDVVAGIPRGQKIGLKDAPDNVPDQESLLNNQPWTTCALSATETHTWLGKNPAEYGSEYRQALVSNNSASFLVSSGSRYPIDRSTQSVLTAFEMVNTANHPVKADWLNALAAGSPLHPLEISGAGNPVRDMPVGNLQSTRVGTLISVTKADRTTGYYVVTGDSQLVELSDVAFRLYLLGTGSDKSIPGPFEADFADIAPLVQPNTGTYPADWPDSFTALLPEDRVPCATWTPGSQLSSTIGSARVPADSIPDRPQVSLVGGSAALIQVSNGGTIGEYRLISDSGFAYGIGGDPADTIARLGYSDTDIITVPQAWAALISAKDDTTPVLSAETAQAGES